MMVQLQEAFGVAVGAGLFAVIFAYGCHYLGGRWTWAVAAATVSWPVLFASDFNASGRYDAAFVPALGSLAAGYALVRWHIEDTRRGGRRGRRGSRRSGRSRFCGARRAATPPAGERPAKTATCSGSTSADSRSGCPSRATRVATSSSSVPPDRARPTRCS